MSSTFKLNENSVLRIDVVRFKKINKSILSRIYINGDLFFCGLENAGLAVPKGIYEGVVYMSKKHGKCLLLKNVAGRTGILFHAGNYYYDSKGCILVGLKHFNDTVVSSRVAMNSLRYYLDKHVVFKIHIVGSDDVLKGVV
jgi:hypothetical protein